MHYVYITTNLVNNKKYIGQRKLPKGKLPRNDNYLGSGNLLLKAIIKYGRYNFKREVIKSGLNQTDADNLEISLIEENNAIESEGFYNIGSGGQFGRSEKHSELTSKAMKEHIKKKKEEDPLCFNKRAIKALITKARSEGKELPFSTYDEYLEHKEQLRIQDEQRKIERKRELEEVRAKKQKQKKFEEWFKSTPMGVEIEKKKDEEKRRKLSVSSKRETKKLWQNDEYRNKVVNSMKKTRKNVGKRMMNDSGNLVGIYLVERGVQSLKDCKVNDRIYKIKRSVNKVEAINRHLQPIADKCKELYDIVIDIEELRSVMIEQFTPNV